MTNVFHKLYLSYWVFRNGLICDVFFQYMLQILQSHSTVEIRSRTNGIWQTDIHNSELFGRPNTVVLCCAST